MRSSLRHRRRVVRATVKPAVAKVAAQPTFPWPAALLGAAIIAFAVLLFIAVPAFAAVPPVSSVSDKLTCQCGCAAVLTECPHQDCGWGIPAKQYIKQQLEAGQSPEALVKYYVDEFGEQVLAAPTKRGFNLLAWVLPFAALIIGAVAMYFLIGVWARRDGADAELVPTRDVDLAPEELKRKLEDELRNFD